MISNCGVTRNNKQIEKIGGINLRQKKARGVAGFALVQLLKNVPPSLPHTYRGDSFVVFISG